MSNRSTLFLLLVWSLNFSQFVKKFQCRLNVRSVSRMCGSVFRQWKYPDNKNLSRIHFSDGGVRNVPFDWKKNWTTLLNILHSIWERKFGSFVRKRRLQTISVTSALKIGIPCILSKHRLTLLYIQLQNYFFVLVKRYLIPLSFVRFFVKHTRLIYCIVNGNTELHYEISSQNI